MTNLSDEAARALVRKPVKQERAEAYARKEAEREAAVAERRAKREAAVAERRAKREAEQARKTVERQKRKTALKSDSELNIALTALSAALDHGATDRAKRERKLQSAQVTVDTARERVKLLRKQLDDAERELANAEDTHDVVSEACDEAVASFDHLRVTATEAWKAHEAAWEQVPASFKKKNRSRAARNFARKLGVTDE